MTEFMPIRVRKQVELTIEAEPGKVFPLLCPVREYEWIAPWRCRLLYSESGVAEDNCIFETDFPHNGGRETWVVSHYEKDHGIEFVRFTADEKIIKLDIRLGVDRAGWTRLLWCKTYTGLSPEGNRVVALVAAEFEQEAQRIALMLNHFLKTGRMLPASDL